MQNKYIGSVLFFKHMILLTIIAVITVLAVLVSVFHSRAAGYRDQMRLYNELTSAALAQTGRLSPAENVDLSGRFSPDAPSYQFLYPDFYAPKKAEPDKVNPKTVYLTFDDGPSLNTRQILDTLDKHNVKATFFVVGATNTENLKVMADAAKRGHTIGMHSFSHKYSYIYYSVENYLKDMYSIFVLIKQYTGITPTVFRFPGGSLSGVNYRLHAQLVAEMLRRGFVPYDWNVSSGDADYGHVTQEKIEENILSGVRKNSSNPFVLMHDSRAKTATARALDRVITELKAEGFNFEKITADIKPVLFHTHFRKEE